MNTHAISQVDQSFQHLQMSISSFHKQCKVGESKENELRLLFLTEQHTVNRGTIVQVPSFYSKRNAFRNGGRG